MIIVFTLIGLLALYFGFKKPNKQIKKPVYHNQEIKKDPYVLSVNFEEIKFPNKDWDKYKKAIANNTISLNRSINFDNGNFIIDCVNLCFDYIENTSIYVNLLGNQAGVTNPHVRDLIDLYSLTVSQFCLWPLDFYNNYPTEHIKQFKTHEDFQELYNNVQTINGMLYRLHSYPMSSDVKLRYDYSKNLLISVKAKFNLKIN